MKAPKDERVYSLLGYAIQCNDYIHMQQIIYLESVLKKNERALKIINNIILQQKDKNILSFREAANLLKQEEEDCRKEFMTVLVKVLCLDGEFDEKEKQYILSVQEDYIWNKRIVKKALRKFNRKIYGNKVKRFLERIWNCLTGKKDFFKFDRKYYEESGKMLLELKKIIEEKELIQKVDSRKVEDDYLRSNIRSELEKIYNELSVSIDEANLKNQELVGKDLTVTLVGRTKAGKSSFFSLLSGGYGQQFIGQGTQRTTKISTVTHVKGIQFIDTPGLNAAVNEGRMDEQYTFEVIRKADFVNIIFVTDSLSLDTKEHIEYIAKKNIPMFIIVNLKNADIFRYEQLLENFLKKDSNWMEDNGVDRIAGWKNNLKRYAIEKHFAHVLDFGEIFIYAARVAKQNLPIEMKITSKEKAEILKKSNYNKVLNRMTQRINKNALLYRWSKYFSNNIEICEKTKKQYGNLLEQIQSRQEICRKSKENHKQKISQFEEKIHNEMEERIDELIRHEVSTDKMRTEAVRLSDKKYKNYIVGLYNKVCSQIQDIVGNVVIEKYNELDVEVKRTMRENPNGKNWNEKVNENDIETNTHKEVITSKEIMDLLGFGLGVMAFIPAIGVPARIASFGTSGLLAWVNDEPSKKERMIKLEEDRLEEISKVFTELKKKVIIEMDQYINSLFYNWEKPYYDKLDYLKKKYQEISLESSQVNHVENTVIAEFAQNILKVRQHRAKFIAAYLQKIEESPALIIKAKRCEEEQISDLYMRIHIVRER